MKMFMVKADVRHTSDGLMEKNASFGSFRNMESAQRKVKSMMYLNSELVDKLGYVRYWHIRIEEEAEKSK